MTAKVKSVLTVASEAIETAAGYALIAVGLYAAIFVDMTGGGSLWSNLRNMDSEGRDNPTATRIIKVPTQVQEEKQHEDRILAVFDSRPPADQVAAVTRAPDAIEQRSSVEMTDSPAEPGAANSWKKSIKGELRSFTVYGRGEQTTSASAANAAPVRVQETPRIAVADGAPAAASAAAPSASRPGIGARLSNGTLSASDTSRNVR